MVLRLSSHTPTKPTVTTGFRLYKPHLQSQSTLDLSNTTFATSSEGSPLFGTNGTMFMPRAHIPWSGSAEKNTHVKVLVKSHSQSREALEDNMRYFVVEDLSASLKDASGKLSVEW